MTRQRQAFALLGFATLAFSSMELVGKMVAGQLSPLQVTFLRFFIGFLILFPFALWEMHKRKIRIQWSDLLWLGILGICNIPIAMVLLQSAVTYIPASLAAVMISANPIFVVIFAHIILKEKVTWQVIIGVTLGIIGLTLVTGVFTTASSVQWTGIIYALASSIFFGLYTVLSKKIVSRLGGAITNAGSFFLGNLVLYCILLVRNEQYFSLNASTIGPMLYLGIVVTGFAYIAFLRGLNFVSAGKGSVIFFFKPVVASLLAAGVLHETLGWPLLMGTLLIIAGSVLMVTRRKRV